MELIFWDTIDNWNTGLSFRSLWIHQDVAIDDVQETVAKKIQAYLVGGWATPLKDMNVNWDDQQPNIWENSKNGNQTTNQLQKWSKCMKWQYMTKMKDIHPVLAVHLTFIALITVITWSFLSHSEEWAQTISMIIQRSKIDSDGSLVWAWSPLCSTLLQTPTPSQSQPKPGPRAPRSHRRNRSASWRPSTNAVADLRHAATVCRVTPQT